MPCHAIATTPISGAICSTCNLMEHRGLNLTTSSPSFRIPSAHVIFIPSLGASAARMSVCILCNVMVARDAQESHLSSKRHARMMKHARGPRACTCSAPAPVPTPHPEVPAAGLSRKRLHIVKEPTKRRPRRTPRPKKKRCRQRSYVTRLMKLRRVGLFTQYARDSEYRARRFLDSPKLRIVMSFPPLKEPYSPFRRAALLLDGIHLTAKMFAFLRIPGTRISWSSALLHLGRDSRRVLALPPRLAPGRLGFHWPRNALAAPLLSAIKNEGIDIQRTSSQKPSVQKASVQKQKTKTKKPPPQKWHCDVCDRTMPLGAKEDHLQGGRHTRKAAKMARVQTPAPRKRRVRGVKEVHKVENSNWRTAIVAK